MYTYSGKAEAVPQLNDIERSGESIVNAVFAKEGSALVGLTMNAVGADGKAWQKATYDGARGIGTYAVKKGYAALKWLFPSGGGLGGLKNKKNINKKTKNNRKIITPQMKNNKKTKRIYLK